MMPEGRTIMSMTDHHVTGLPDLTGIVVHSGTTVARLECSCGWVDKVDAIEARTFAAWHEETGRVPTVQVPR